MRGKYFIGRYVHVAVYAARAYSRDHKSCRVYTRVCYYIRYCRLKGENGNIRRPGQTRLRRRYQHDRSTRTFTRARPSVKHTHTHERTLWNSFVGVRVCVCVLYIIYVLWSCRRYTLYHTANKHLFSNRRKNHRANVLRIVAHKILYSGVIIHRKALSDCNSCIIIHTCINVFADCWS